MTSRETANRLYDELGPGLQAPATKRPARVMNSSAENPEVHDNHRFHTAKDAVDASICFKDSFNDQMKSYRQKIWDTCQSSKEFREKNEFYEDIFSKIFNAKDSGVSQVYHTLVDFVIWINKLFDSEFVEKKDYNDFNLMCNICTEVFCASVEKFEENDMKQAVEDVCATECLDQFLYCICRSKWYKMYRLAFDYECFNDEFNRYLGSNKTFYKRGKDALRWIIEMKFYRKHRPERIITMAMLENMLINLIAYYEVERPKDLQVKFDADHMVSFLDRAIVSARNRRYYLRGSFDTGFDTVAKECAERLVTRVRESTLTRTVFSLCKTFKLAEDFCKYSMFVRRLTSFFTVVREYRNHHESAKNEEDRDDIFDIFQQRVRHLFKGSPLMRYAGLKYIMEESVGEALFFAHYTDIPRGDWPQELKEEDTEDMKKQLLPMIDAYDRRVYRESESIKDGFTIEDNHRILVIDSHDRLVQLQRFVLNNKEVGFDAEWDQSYTAEMGVLGLIQLSSKDQTMLVDIEAFRKLNANEDQWIGIFKMIFAGERKIYGFAYESDLKTIVHNFPCVEDIIIDNMKNLVCLRNAMVEISSNLKAGMAIFGEILPERHNLQSLAVELLGWQMEKIEQASVWSERPLRKNQQIYAAKDSLACYLIGKLFEERLKDLVDMADIFHPLKVNFHSEKVKESKMAGNKKYDALLAENKTQSGKKTKSNHFTRAELIELVETINTDLKTRIPPEELVKPESLRFCADSMCSQISSMLRRCGISVLTEDFDKNFIRVHANPDMKVLTTGKFVAKYPPGQAVDLPSSVATLDKQLATFMESQKVIIDTKTMTPRCCKCNSKNLCYVPTPVVRYLHCTYAIANMHKMSHCSYTMQDLSDYAEQCKKLNPRTPLGMIFCIFAGSNIIYKCSSGQIDMKKLSITKAEQFRPVNVNKDSSGVPISAKYVQISLATHLDYKQLDIPEGTFHIFCTYCGKENVEGVVHTRKL